MSGKVFVAIAASVVGTLCTDNTALAEPVKIALIETLSGPAALTGKLIQTAVKFALIQLKDEKAWPDGIKLLEYDNQGGPSEASDKVKAAINDGAQIIIQGASSAIGGQITADVQKHNARNPGKEIIYLNVGAEAMEFTGPKCHFYHFRWNGNAEIRLKAMLIGHEGGQCARQQGLHHRPELQLGPRRAEADARIRQAVRLYDRRRRDPRREQDPGFRAVRRQDQGGGARHGGHGQLVATTSCC